ncbi:MAG TPA: hypothetical protein VGC80_08710 [Acetobacteraceae bacterium]
MKIAICIPCHRDTKARFTHALAGMAIHAAREIPDEIKTILAQGPLLEVREGLVHAARGWGADWILWLDADHTFPNETLVRLLGHGKDVVACNYPRRAGAPEPVAQRNGRLVQTTEALARRGAVEPVDAVGLGICLMRASVFDRLDPPYFQLELKPDGSGYVSEDFTLFRRLKRAGVTPYVDHGLSWKIGHIGDLILTTAAMAGGGPPDAG